MYGPREILNEFRWRDDRDLALATLWYVHRGAPNDTRIIGGADIKRVGASFMEVRGPRSGTMIPFHRVYRIDYEDRAFWMRSNANPEKPCLS